MSSQNAQFPETGFVRADEVARFLSISQKTWWCWVADGKAPKSIKLSRKCTVWNASEIWSWINEKAA